MKDLHEENFLVGTFYSNSIFNISRRMKTDNKLQYPKGSNIKNYHKRQKQKPNPKNKENRSTKWSIMY